MLEMEQPRHAGNSFKISASKVSQKNFVFYTEKCLKKILQIFMVDSKHFTSFLTFKWAQ